MTASSLHKTLVQKIKENKRDTNFDIGHYVGTSHTMYNLPTPTLHALAKDFHTQHQDIPAKMCIELADRLFHAPSFEEIVLSGMILGTLPHILTSIPSSSIDTWMGLLTGWAEVDTTCDEIDIWVRHDPRRGIPLLIKWTTDPILEKRRASLVVLCSSVRHDPDPKWKDLGFTFIGVLTKEKHVMITKAISWLLRAMIKHHKNDVASYIQLHRETLPKIAVREATKKLLTGRKN